MAISVFCYLCEKELDEPGTIMLFPPDEYGMAEKQHICVRCTDGQDFMEELEIASGHLQTAIDWAPPENELVCVNMADLQMVLDFLNH